MTVASRPSYICTYSGLRFNPLYPDWKLINIHDIAHGLSNICRYGGQCQKFYSVAQHSVIVAQNVSPENAGWGLLHDAPEAYIGDIVAPLKVQDEYIFYREAEDRLMDAIAYKFGLDLDAPPEVKEFDLIVRETEMRDFGSVPEDLRGNYSTLDQQIIPLLPDEAKELFLIEFRHIFGTEYL